MEEKLKPTPEQIVRLIMNNASDSQPAELQESPASTVNSKRILELVRTLGVDGYLNLELWDLCKNFYSFYCTNPDIVVDTKFGDVFSVVNLLIDKL